MQTSFDYDYKRPYESYKLLIELLQQESDVRLFPTFQPYFVTDIACI